MTTNIKKLTLTALMVALTFVGTYIIKVPTPTGGYVHPGDGFVLLSGIVLGPVWGALAAGLGSALSDLIGGYGIYIPATFIIKAAVAFVMGITFENFRKLPLRSFTDSFAIVLGGIVGEAIMVVGYFLFEFFIINNVYAAASIFANAIQGAFGVIIAVVIWPFVSKVVSESIQ